MNIDYIVVGLGLAGLSFTEELIRNNKNFIVFEDDSQTSSVVAGGVYNPVILKRFTPAWNAHEQIQIAIPFYKKLEQKFNQIFDYEFSTKKVFHSIGDENNWFIASDKPVLKNYMNPKIFKEKINGVIGNFGFGELKGTGRINTTKLIATYRKYLLKQERLRQEKFEYSLIEILENSIKYKGITTTKIVFCEGYGLKQNPFFNYLPLNGTKGETIDIKAPNLNINFLLKSSVFVMPLKNDIYKVGATFNWEDKTCKPTLGGKKELKDKLAKTITVPYEVVGQSAGIRPTVKDRRPLVGTHPKHKNLIVLNGLGTRGVLIAPTVAKNLFNHLEKGEELDKEITITRFD